MVLLPLGSEPRLGGAPADMVLYTDERVEPVDLSVAPEMLRNAPVPVPVVE